MNRPLQRNKRDEKQSTFDANGNCTVFITVPLGPAWEVKQVSIRTESVLETTASTFIGTNSSGIFISKSFTANDDTDSQPNVTLRSGDSIACVWAGGTPNTVARLTIIYDEVDY